MKYVKDYLHFYLGCECIRPFDGKRFKLTPINLEWAPSEQWKPLLRPLSDINKDEVADLMGVKGFIKEGNWCPPFFQLRWEDLNYEQHSQHEYLVQLSPDQFFFLLSKHFDIFDLITEGLAIDATKKEATT